MNHFKVIYDLKEIYTVLAQNSAKNVIDDDTVEYVIPNLQAYNYMFTYLDIVREIADIDFESITDDVIIIVNSNGEYLSSLTFQLDGVNFEYVFSNFNSVTDLTLPEVTFIEEKEEETGIYYIGLCKWFWKKSYRSGLRTGMSRLEEKNQESSNSITETVGLNRESILASCNFKS